MDCSEDQQSNNESQDLLDITNCTTNPSPGPALVSNSSLDSPLIDEPLNNGQRPSLSDTIKPNDLVDGVMVAAIRDVAGEPAVLVPESSMAGQTGAAPSPLLDGGDPLQARPSISEAEAYADHLTREILNDTNSLVRSTVHSDELMAGVASAAQEVVESAIAQGTDMIAREQGEAATVPADTKDADFLNMLDTTVETAAPPLGKQGLDIKDMATIETTKKEEPIDDTQPIVKEKKMMNVAIGPVVYQFSADSLEESQIEEFNKDDSQEEERKEESSEQNKGKLCISILFIIVSRRYIEVAAIYCMCQLPFYLP